VKRLFYLTRKEKNNLYEVAKIYNTSKYFMSWKKVVESLPTKHKALSSNLSTTPPHFLHKIHLDVSETHFKKGILHLILLQYILIIVLF
jgi:hypothetical protein